MNKTNQTIKNNFIKILQCILFFCVFYVTYIFVNMAVVDTDSATRLSLHDFYNQENIDLAIIGTSRVNRGFNPELADELLGINTFNMATPSQTFDGSYYYLKELIKNYNPKTVFFNVEFDFMTRAIGQQKCNWIISDYMKGINRYQYILNVFEKEEWPIMLSGIYRYRQDITKEYCLNNLKAKLNANYWNYNTENKYYKNYQWYIGKGFCWAEKAFPEYSFFGYENNYSEFEEVNVNKFNSEAIYYLIKSIELCKENDVEIILLTMPQTNLFLNHAGNYQEYTDYMKKLSAKYEISYYDFNLLKDDQFFDHEFTNLDHLTLEGANHFTRDLCALYKDCNSLTFVDSLDDRPREGIIGVTYNYKQGDRNNRKLQWNIESFEQSNYLVKVIEKNENTVIFESALIAGSEIEYPLEENSITILEIYDMEKHNLGNCVLQ